MASQSFGGALAKAGVIIRATLDANASNAATLITAGNGHVFQRRPLPGAATLNTPGGAGAAPGWVRIKRTGSLFTAYRSNDGLTWTVIGADAIDMPDSVYVGIAVSSGSSTAATDVVADSLRATSSAPVNQPPTVSLTAPAGGAVYTAPAASRSPRPPPIPRAS